MPQGSTCSAGLGAMSPFEAAEVALRILHMLAQLHPAVDPRGYILQPLPLVHRQLVAPSSLPHLTQACPVSGTLLPASRVYCLSISAQCPIEQRRM